MTRILKAMVGAALLFLWAGVPAQTWPARPITLINPLSTGGGADAFLRALAKEMQPLLGQAVMVESRTGAGGLIAGEYVARARPDGYVIGDLQSTQLMPEVFAAIRKPAYSSDDLRVVVRVFYLPSAMVTRAGLPFRDMTGFVRHVQQHPDTVSFADTVGEGHPLHLLGRAIFKAHSMRLTEVPYKGAGDALVALLGGHVDVGYPLSIASVQAHAQAGKLQILAIDSLERVPSLPDIPTLKELGFNAMAPNYHVFAVPRATPEAVVTRLHDAVKAALDTPAMREFARRSVSTIYYGSEADALAEIAQNRRDILPLLEDVLSRKK